VQEGKEEGLRGQGGRTKGKRKEEKIGKEEGLRRQEEVQMSKEEGLK
jgi:hypothetical protein